MKIFGTEPASLVTFAMLGLQLAVSFGLPLTPVQSEIIQKLLDSGILLLGGYLIRRSVISVAAVDTVQGKGAADTIAAAHKAGETQTVVPDTNDLPLEGRVVAEAVTKQLPKRGPK